MISKFYYYGYRTVATLGASEGGARAHRAWEG